MAFSDSDLQSLRARCLTALTYQRELALADDYLARLEAEAGPLSNTGHSTLASILGLIQRILAKRLEGASRSAALEEDIPPVVVDVPPVKSVLNPVSAPDDSVEGDGYPSDAEEVPQQGDIPSGLGDAFTQNRDQPLPAEEDTLPAEEDTSLVDDFLPNLDKPLLWEDLSGPEGGQVEVKLEAPKTAKAPKTKKNSRK